MTSYQEHFSVRQTGILIHAAANSSPTKAQSRNYRIHVILVLLIHPRLAAERAFTSIKPAKPPRGSTREFTRSARGSRHGRHQLSNLDRGHRSANYRRDDSRPRRYGVVARTHSPRYKYSSTSDACESSERSKERPSERARERERGGAGERETIYLTSSPRETRG